MLAHRGEYSVKQPEQLHVSQAVSKLEGLDACIMLEQLWLTENAIQVIEGLDDCTKMQRLYLYSNHISSIQGLDRLTNLEVFHFTP